jgi:hypothetical protein
MRLHKHLERALVSMAAFRRPTGQEETAVGDRHGDSPSFELNCRSHQGRIRWLRRSYRHLLQVAAQFNSRLVPILRASDELPSTTRELAVRGGLDAVQLRVLAFLGHQLLVRAELH